MKNLAIAILNWNGKAHLERFLPSVINYSNDAVIYVIDNASTDDSIAFLEKSYPSVKIIKNVMNAGFAGGYNEGLKLIEEEFYLLLNSDVEVSENWLNPLMDFMNSHPNCVALQPKILAYTNKTYFEHAGAAGGFLDKDAFPFCRGRLFHQVEEDKGQYDSPMEVFWASGACLLIRKSAFEEVGGFDIHFFAHMEEIDLCYRLKNLGYEIWCVPQSVVYHLGGGTLTYDSPNKTYLNFRNNLYLIHKNYRESNLFVKLFRRLSWDGIAALQFLVKGKLKHFWAIIRAHVSYYGHFRQLNAQRRESTYNAKEINGVGRYHKSIVVEFYLRKKKLFSQLNSSDFSRKL